MKKIISYAMLIMLSLAVIGCGKTSSSEASSESAKNEGEPVLTLITTSHASWPFQEDWYVKRISEEKTGVTLDVTAILDENQAFVTKLNMQIVSGKIPDMIAARNKDAIKIYADQGVFLNILDHMDKLPNFSKWLEDNRAYAAEYFTSPDELYVFPAQGIQEGNRRGWLYREDIFTKHNLSVPTTDQELLEVLRELKQLYPDSYPLAFRSGMGQFLQFAPSWNTNWQITSLNEQFYYDYDKDEWRFGPIEDNFKELVVFFHTLYKEGLIPPNLLTLTTTEWQGLISNDTSFITFDYLSRINFFMGLLSDSNEEFVLKYMAPIQGGSNGQRMISNTAIGFYGMIPSAHSKNQDALLAYCDWLYTEEARELTSWGEEGVTYDVVDGERRFKDVTDIGSLRKIYGFGNHGFNTYFDFDAHVSLYTPLVKEAVEESRNYDLPKKPALEFNDEELEVAQTIGLNIDKITNQEIAKFLLGNRPLDEWDDYVKEIESLGLDKLKAIYVSSHERTK